MEAAYLSHIALLEAVQSRVPGRAQQAIERAIERAPREYARGREREQDPDGEQPGQVVQRGREARELEAGAPQAFLDPQVEYRAR